MFKDYCQEYVWRVTEAFSVGVGMRQGFNLIPKPVGPM